MESRKYSGYLLDIWTDGRRLSLVKSLEVEKTNRNLVGLQQGQYPENKKIISTYQCVLCSVIGLTKDK